MLLGTQSINTTQFCVSCGGLFTSYSYSTRCDICREREQAALQRQAQQQTISGCYSGSVSNFNPYIPQPTFPIRIELPKIEYPAKTFIQDLRDEINDWIKDIKKI